MSDRRCLESLDRTLRDILDEPNIPFGGTSILLGGDFRQTLPVKPKAGKNEILNLSIPRSSLWMHFKVLRLNENMRISNYPSGSENVDVVKRFSKRLLSVADGELDFVEKEGCNDVKTIEIPPEFLIHSKDNPLLDLIHFIYDEDVLAAPTSENLSDRAIVCPKNETTADINEHILNMSPGDCVTYLSIDSVVLHNHDTADTELMYPTEYLNLLTFSGIPAHQLRLKKKTYIMLMRNINQTSCLCNGTRLIVTQLLTKVIEAHVITGTAAGSRVYIPRINFILENKDLPFIFKRRQFPVKVCYAMTINKSQGQSLNKIGVYLPQPVFGHGLSPEPLLQPH